MSLHLIESRAGHRSEARNSGGTAMSVVLHVAFATAILTLATNAPALSAPKPEEHRIILDNIVEPPKHEYVATRSRGQSSSMASDNAVPLNLPAPIDIATVPVEMPSLSNAVTADYSARVSRGGGVGTGGSGQPFEPNAALSDFQVDKPVFTLPGARAPKYPDALRAAGVEDTVVATFVVDTLGRVEANTFEVKNAPHAPFILSVREALLTTKYKPAEAQGHLVRQRVVQAFVFSLTR